MRAATVTFQTWLIGVTIAAPAGIVLCGINGWRAWRKGGHGEDGHTPGLGDTESPQRLLGHASVLLSVVSFIGVIFVIMPRAADRQLRMRIYGILGFALLLAISVWPWEAGSSCSPPTCAPA